MKTLVLQALQQPTHVEKMLHHVVESAGLVPTDAAPIRDRKSLPATLRRIIALATNIGQSWACWADKHEHVWLFVAEMPLVLSRERGTPVLQVDQYGEDGEIKDTGKWVTGNDEKWRRFSE